MKHNYLEAVDDGLSMRPSGDYAKDKLDILERFLDMFTTSMRDRWTAISYVDLEAGPGKNELRDSQEIILGSPLIALKYEFDHYFFVEKQQPQFEALHKRVVTSPKHDHIRTYNDDCNVAVYEIVRAIKAIEAPASNRIPRSLNLVFVDPEGLEIHWNTIKLLGEETRSDLIINFSTSGITRNIKQFLRSKQDTALDLFFGVRAWRQVYERLHSKENTAVRRVMIDLYAKQLQELSYKTTEPNGEHIVLNSKNRQLYCLLCASKHELGVKFFHEAAAKFNTRRLPGFA